MHLRLAEILKEKKREVARLKRDGSAVLSPENGLKIRDFSEALTAPSGISLIAEIKFASPSAGIIRDKSDPLAIGGMYEEKGASAISLLTDRKFFGGSLENMMPLKQRVSLPVLRKDFIIDEVQVEESRRHGADAILLIVRILSSQQYKDLMAAAESLGLAVLTEVHDGTDLETALECGARIVGINNRDLDTFRVDFSTTLKLAPRVPAGRIVVSESGIATPEDVARIKTCGVHSVLVGTSIMKSPDPEKQVEKLVLAGKGISG